MNISNTRSNDGQTVAPEATPAVRRKLATTAAELMAERQGQLPVWIRAPKSGPEHYCGFSRAKLYELAGDGKIRSVSIREAGRSKGTRLFHLGSILDFVAQCEASAEGDGAE
ncbi:MAG: hypothetical protein EBS84_19410 [Proteobacteria bacterium]|nr:hypothetical protein [Pseudomonadota bacterium]